MYTLESYVQHISFSKRYPKIDQHLARHFEYYGGCLSSPPPFLSRTHLIFKPNCMIRNSQKNLCFCAENHNCYSIYKNKVKIA